MGKVVILYKRRSKMKIYVGNLSRDVNDEDLLKAFESFGKVESATVVKDKFTGVSRGFGFVEMSSAAEAQSAIDGMKGKDLKGRAVNVNEARPREESGRGRGRTGGRPGGGRRY
jgi:RNA recognition motif-containing protein